MRRRQARRAVLLLGWLGVGTAVATTAGADEPAASTPRAGAGSASGRGGPSAPHTRFSAVGYGGAYRSSLGCGAGAVGVRYAGVAARGEWAEEGVDAPAGEGWGARLTAAGQSTHAEIVECDTDAGCPDPKPPARDFVQGFGQATVGYGWRHLGLRAGVALVPGDGWDADATPSQPRLLPAGELTGRYEWAGLRLGFGLPCLACGNAAAPYGALDVLAWEGARLSLVGAETGAGTDLRVPVHGAWGVAGGFLLGENLGHPASVGFLGVSYDGE